MGALRVKIIRDKATLRAWTGGLVVECFILTYVCMYVCMYVFMYACMYDLIFYGASAIFQLCKEGSSWVETVLS